MGHTTNGSGNGRGAIPGLEADRLEGAPGSGSNGHVGDASEVQERAAGDAGGARRPGGKRKPRAREVDSIAALERKLRRVQSEWGHPEDPAKALYPDLWPLLADRVSTKGEERKAGAIRIVLTPIGVEASMTHDDLGHRLIVKCSHLGEALEALNAAVMDPRADWRPIDQGKGAQRRRERYRAEKAKREARDDED